MPALSRSTPVYNLQTSSTTKLLRPTITYLPGMLLSTHVFNLFNLHHHHHNNNNNNNNNHHHLSKLTTASLLLLLQACIRRRSRAPHVTTAVHGVIAEIQLATDQGDTNFDSFIAHNTERISDIIDEYQERHE